MDDRGSILGSGRFSLRHYLQTDYGAHPMGGKGSFPGGLSGRVAKFTSHTIYCRGLE